MALRGGAPAQVLIEHQGSVAVIRLSRPPVNALSPDLARGLKLAVAQAAEDPNCLALVLTGQGRCFSAGADVNGFGASVGSPHELPALLESLSKPVVAALHGEVLGAGLELALACHARVARHDAALGLPEIKLGLIPGAGGTQRLPRLIGEQTARALMLSGRALSGLEALAIGLVDEGVSADPVSAARALALRLAQGNWKRASPASPAGTIAPPGPRTRLPEPAAGAIESCLQAARNLPLGEGLALESRWFHECLQSPDAMALQHAFTAERRARRVPGMPEGLAARPLHRALVVGAGTMGRGIAICLADAGLAVELIEPDGATRERAQAAIDQHYGALEAKQRLNRTEAASRLGRIHLASDLGLASGADLVIEAVFENMALKRGLFAELDRLCRPGALLATNTSSLDVDRIAAATHRPQDVLGLHFFSPAPVMRLLEVVRGELTSWQALADGLALGRRLQKVPVVSRVGPGFIGNRMVGPYGRQAERLLLEGATPEQVDRALQAFGFPMGPHAVGDLVGLDVGVRAAREAPARADARDGAIARRLVAMGRLGQKSGAGLYRYEPGSRAPHPDPDVHALIRDEAHHLGITPRDIDDAEIVQRCMLALINEGAALLGEGIAMRAGDIDTVWLNGYGFPRWLGGPMHHADRMGLPHVLDLLTRWQGHSGGDEALWSPAPLLVELARSGRSFADWDTRVV